MGIFFIIVCFVFFYPTTCRHLLSERGERSKRAFFETINLAVLRLDRFSLFKGKWRSQKGKRVLVLQKWKFVVHPNQGLRNYLYKDKKVIFNPVRVVNVAINMPRISSAVIIIELFHLIITITLKVFDVTCLPSGRLAA